jgi:hypothetical protein
MTTRRLNKMMKMSIGLLCDIKGLQRFSEEPPMPT